MDSYNSKREVEKIKPWGERAQKCSDRLFGIIDAHRLIYGNYPSQLVDALLDTTGLLAEAAMRGVKGKDQ